MPESSNSTNSSLNKPAQSVSSAQISQNGNLSSTSFSNSSKKEEQGENFYYTNSTNSNFQSISPTIGSSSRYTSSQSNIGQPRPGIISQNSIVIPKNALFRETIGNSPLPLHLLKHLYAMDKVEDPTWCTYSSNQPGSNQTNTQTSLLSENKENDLLSLESGKISRKKKGIRRCFGFLDYQISKVLGIIILLFSLLIISGVTIALYHVEGKKGLPELKTQPGRYKTLKYLKLDLVDKDTPMKYHSRIGGDGKNWTLTFSDEFNLENRTFYRGDDQFFTAMDYHYGVTGNMEYYSPEQVTTYEGTLRMTLDEKKSKGLNYTSGMLQSWNQLCINQGYVEVSVRLPGSYDSKGLWPAIWLLGNLGRAGYQASTDGVWPYSYDSCDVSVSANQSSDDGLSHLPGMRLSACTCDKQDHPSLGRSRGAPEIDIMEGLHNKIAQSYNIAPFDIWRYPDYDHILIPNKNITSMNSFMGSSFQEAISAVTTTNPNWFEQDYRNFTDFKTLKTKAEFITIGMEYMSYDEDNMKNYIKYYLGGEKVFEIGGGAFHPDGNVGWRTIPKEPLSLIFNLAMSKSWSDVQVKTIQFPVNFDVDYVRVYQPPGQISMTCDPEKYPTVDYINNHWKAYANHNFTSWEIAGYKLPKNSLKNKCKPAKISEPNDSRS